MEVVERRRGGAKIHSETCDGEISDFTKRWKFEEGGGYIAIDACDPKFQKVDKKIRCHRQPFRKVWG